MRLYWLGCRRIGLVLYVTGCCYAQSGNLYMLSVMYKHKRITVGVEMVNPFVDNYKRINETWNFQFGRNYQSGGKKIWNQDTDTGVMNTSK